MKQGIFTVCESIPLTRDVYKLRLEGDTSAITNCGQFVNLKIDGLFLRRPISVCDVEGDILTVVFRAVGAGTERMAAWKKGDSADILTGLGNGFDTSLSGERPLLIGGGLGCTPMMLTAKRLISEGRKVSAVLGFNTKDELILEDELCSLGADVTVTTADGSYGIKGFVTDALGAMDYTYFYACGPEAMLKALCRETKTPGELSFEQRMGCGFGACMGCTCKTLAGNKRICKDGPVLKKEELLWGD